MRYLAIRSRRVVTALLLASLAGCLPPTNPSEGEGTFEGLYAQGFEVSAFQPCTSGARTSDSGYWLTANTEFGQKYNALATTRGPNAFGPTVYTRFQGTLSAVGRYGHLGAYAREVTVTRMLSMEVRERCP